MRLILIYLLLSFIGVEISLPPGDEWPDWRGPSRDGTWTEKGVLTKFDFDEFDIKWRVPVSSGYSGPTIESGKVYLTDRQTRPDQVERVL